MSFLGGRPLAFYDLTTEEQVEALAYMTRRSKPEGWGHVAALSAGELAGVLGRMLEARKPSGKGNADAYLEGGR